MRVLIVDDHPLIREALTRVLTSIASEAVVLEAVDPRLALDMIEREPHLDLVLLDLALPGMHGMTALQSMRERHPAISVVVVSASADRESVKQALDHGAMGFIPKSSSIEVMQNALRLVLAGGVYLPPEILGRSDAAAFASWPAHPTAHAQANVGHMTTAQIGLTERQAQILALMMKGESNKMICRELHVAESTVKNQITAILKALNVTSRTQAVLEVTKLGLVLPAMRGKDQ